PAANRSATVSRALSIVWYADGTRHNGTKWDGTGWNRMGRNGEGAKMSLDGNNEEEKEDRELFQGVRQNENSPKIRPVKQRVPPVLDAPNVGLNASSHSVPSRPVPGSNLISHANVVIPILPLVMMVYYVCDM
ncbi:hypothetical protein DVH24_024910, partial [Malus domestica]